MLWWTDSWVQLCACVWAGRRRYHIKHYGLCAHIYAAQFDISASYCVQRSAAAGGIFSCFIHELINGAQIALLSILTNTQPACVCLLRRSSLLAEGRRKQHKLSIQLNAPQKIWHCMRTYAMLESPFILRPSPVLSLLRAVGMIFPQLCVCLEREPAGPFYWIVCMRFLSTSTI